ncbi:MAG: hypothetical protein P8R42_29415 [Candidatus Binatia bacterium]|nr:hypothetical protein [Candidatus Binatia bacterium]
MSARFRSLFGACAALTLVAGCAASQGQTSSTSSAAADTAADTAPGMNAKGEVVDSSSIQSGSGKTVKGINDWEGEITGKPFPGSKFTKLKIGMSRAQVVDLMGPPTDEGAYVTAKAFIPFYYGSDTSRIELAYKGQGRLIFSTGAGWGTDRGHLTWIIYNKNDSGYR